MNENQTIEEGYDYIDGEVTDFSLNISFKKNPDTGDLEQEGMLFLNDLVFEFSSAQWEQFKKMIPNS